MGPQDWPGKARPIIVHFLSDQDKQNVLDNGYTLKFTGFSVGEDFSGTTRFERKKRLEYAKSLDGRF